MPKKISEEIKLNIKNDKWNGLPINEIIKKYGADKKTVYKIYKMQIL